MLRVGVTAKEAGWTITAALIGAAAFPPVGFPFFSLISIALFLILLASKNSSDARPLGMLYGLVYGLGTMYWFFGIFKFLAIPLIALMSGYFGILATLIGMTKGRSLWVRAVFTGLFAVAIEWLRGDAWYLRF